MANDKSRPEILINCVINNFWQGIGNIHYTACMFIGNDTANFFVA